MARPSTHDDVADYRKSTPVADFHLGEFTHDPDVTQAYAAFVRVASKRLGAVADRNGKVSIPADKAKLDELLASDQADWDTKSRRYDEVLEAVANGHLPERWQDYEAFGLRTWAQREGKGPVPLLIDRDDELRRLARAVLEASGDEIAEARAALEQRLDLLKATA
ncbi:hypothetical protein GODINES_82 [Mycobacterium phage Godines]|uniref:Uncharacterized protein n=1 Tax=Mycobacterium phage Godines TaxID=1675551 RepID=A0A0K1LRT1_9CAUD|nr:hypothetical protein FDI79_gp82 [Mycobacterium phage Godines]AKU45281.1 hypothetical protein GODINES_82 [Mycobacterium phage Godines]